MSRRILLVDDDESIRQFVALALSDAGHEVVTAENGRDALALAARSRPDLIVLDLRMPVMDGWAFAQEYRATPRPHAPIVVLTAARDAAQSAAEVQAEACLAKPFALADLLAVVAGLLPR